MGLGAAEIYARAYSWPNKYVLIAIMLFYYHSGKKLLKIISFL